MAKAAKTLHESDRKYRHHRFVTTCQDAIKSRKRYKTQILHGATQDIQDAREEDDRMIIEISINFNRS